MLQNVLLLRQWQRQRAIELFWNMTGRIGGQRSTSPARPLLGFQLSAHHHESHDAMPRTSYLRRQGSARGRQRVQVSCVCAPMRL